jgi:hypothetical protein
MVHYSKTTVEWMSPYEVPDDFPRDIESIFLFGKHFESINQISMANNNPPSLKGSDIPTIGKSLVILPISLLFLFPLIGGPIRYSVA